RRGDVTPEIRTLTPQRVEAASLVVWTSEVPNRRADRHITHHTILHTPRLHQLAASCAETGVREAEREYHLRRIALLDLEFCLILSLAERYRIDRDFVRKLASIESKGVRIIDAQ